jgi:MFS family permease
VGHLRSSINCKYPLIFERFADDNSIMFRWLQGLGASGVLAIGTVYGFELRPPEKWPAYSAVISLAVVIALAVAPVIGASLTDVGKWRWIFLIK